MVVSYVVKVVIKLMIQPHFLWPAGWSCSLCANPDQDGTLPRLKDAKRLSVSVDMQ
ncbi:Isopentenyl-diphosphate Delta-isomerase 1, partial [Clarias magur]